jgi:rSAM/selenodomain-associated transferase 1
LLLFFKKEDVHLLTCAIAVMAKAPQAGRCKTRLVPPLTHDQAASMSRAFLRDITENLFAAASQVPIAPHIAYAPAGHAALFDGIVAPGTRLILADGSIDVPAGVEGFGRSLLHAVQGLLSAGYGSACVLNSDSPTMPTAFLRRAAEILAAPGDTIVMGPAEDGGYTLLGMKAAHAHLFRDIAWSTDIVAEQTRSRAREAGLRLVELPPWYDVDDAMALLRLQADLFDGGNAYPAPYTAAQMRAIGYGAPHRVAS